MMKKILGALNFSPFRAGCLLIVLSCLVFHSFGSRKPSLLSAMDNRIMDIKFRVRGPEPPTGKVAIVDIDEKSLRRIGQWPWPRDVLAELVNGIHKADALAAGFDIVFAESDRTSPVRYFESLDPSLKKKIPERVLQEFLNKRTLDHDSLFGEAVSKGPTILGYPFITADDGLKEGSGVPFPSGRIMIHPKGIRFDELALKQAYRAVVNVASISQSKSEGFFNVFTDESGTVRRVPLLMMMDGIPYPSLALETFRIGRGADTLTIHASDRIRTYKKIVLGISVGDDFIPTDSRGQILVNFRGPERTFEYVSAVDVIQGKEAHKLRDRFVLIGSSASGLFDLKATPFSSTVPGVEINAAIIDNMLKQDPFVYDKYTEIAITYLVIVAGGLLLAGILAFAGPVAGAAGAILYFAGISAGNYYFFFLNNKQVGMTYPFATSLLILVTVTTVNYFREGRAKRYIQKAFSHYVAPEVVSRLMKDPGSLSLRGEQKDLTVMFCDIRGFTSISERMDSRDLGRVMNRFLTVASRMIMENGGTVDKFIGDAVMAFWGAPGDDPDHAVHAVRTALLMKTELKERMKTENGPELPDLSVGIGLNSGVVSVGNFGSMERFDYTVMGDHVNLASRLEGINKTYGTTVIMSGFTEEKVRGRFSSKFVDRVRVKGRNEPVDLYEPVAELGPPPSS